MKRNEKTERRCLDKFLSTMSVDANEGKNKKEVRRSINEVLNRGKETMTEQKRIHKRSLDSILNGNSRKGDEEIKSIVKRVFEKNRYSFEDAADLFYYADLLSDTDTDLLSISYSAMASVETLGEAIGYICDPHRYRFTGFSEDDMGDHNKSKAEDLFRSFNKILCQMLIRWSSTDPDIRQMLKIHYADFVTCVNGESTIEGYEYLKGNVRVIIEAILHNMDTPWDFVESPDRYAERIRNYADSMERMIIKPLLEYYHILSPNRLSIYDLCGKKPPVITDDE